MEGERGGLERRGEGRERERGRGGTERRGGSERNEGDNYYTCTCIYIQGNNVIHDVHVHMYNVRVHPEQYLLQSLIVSSRNGSSPFKLAC